jgi:gliding motility-associated-like protein
MVSLLKILWIALINMAVCMFALAQPYPSDQGAFQVSQKEGCAPLTVSITELTFTGFCTCNYRVNGVLISPTHTFTTPGTYVITGIAQSGANPSSDQITITVNAPTQPAIEISTCASNRVSVKVNATEFDTYLVDFDNNLTDDATIVAGGSQTANFTYGTAGIKTITVRGKDNNAIDNCPKRMETFNAVAALAPATIQSLTVDDAQSVTLTYQPAANTQYRAVIATNGTATFQPFQNFNNGAATTQTLIQNGLATDNNYYCFRINAVDPCNNTTLNSNTICSTNFDVVALPDVNQLTWATDAAGVTNYTLERDQAAYQTVGIQNYNDTNIDCNVEYDYRVRINYVNGSTSTSLPKTVIAQTAIIPTTIVNTSAIVGDNTVDLTWIQDPAFMATNYLINRSGNGSIFQSIGQSTTPAFTDVDYTTSESFCYKINYTDACLKNSVLSEAVCPMRLVGSTNAVNAVFLSWSAYTGWQQGVMRYRIEKMDASGTLLNTFFSADLSFLDDTEDPDNQIVQYLIIAEPQTPGLTESVSNIITVRKRARLIFPTAFTPNQDQLNDTFTVVGQFVESMTLQIFDRWGRLVFSTDNNEAWNGTFEGKLMPESTYVWKAFITDQAGTTFSEVGSVALLKK